MHGFLEILVSGRDDAHVDFHGARGADGLELPGLKHAQQFDLEVKRQIAHFVQEDRAAMGELEAALPILSGAGESAFHVPEKLGFEQLRLESRRS